MPTARLLLRPWSAAEVSAVVGEGRLPHWAEDFPAEGDRVIALLLTEHSEWLGEFGHRQIVERASGLVVGSIGLFWPPRAGEVEFGYGVVPSRRGRGYATEAVRALVAFALNAPGVRAVYAEVDPANPASARVLRKAGLPRVHAEVARERFRLTAAEASGS
nr:GNAT family N-acetyltransferase [Streptomyces hoynatensis]